MVVAFWVIASLTEFIVHHNRAEGIIRVVRHRDRSEGNLCSRNGVGQQVDICVLYNVEP